MDSITAGDTRVCLTMGNAQSWLPQPHSVTTPYITAPLATVRQHRMSSCHPLRVGKSQFGTFGRGRFPCEQEAHTSNETYAGKYDEGSIVAS